jgi:DNA polymerase-3 subunit gamma/tau
VLDQLMGGAGPDGVTHELASGLLGYTPDALLDEVVDAFAAADGAAVFGVVDKVIETGQDPRRFTEDLLRRLRDLVIVAAVPGATATGLIDVSEDQGERLVAQAARFGATDLSRAADILATGLTEMRGATAPRLLLELLCARVLLPGADHSTAGLAARLDRLERRAAITGTPSAAAPTAAPPPAQDRPAQSTPTAVGKPVAEQEPVVEAAAVIEPAVQAPAEPATQRQDEPQPAPTPAATSPLPPVGGGAALSLVDVRRLWPDIVEATKTRRRMAWIHLTQNCQVVGLDGTVLTLGFANAGARDSFVSSGCTDVVHQAAIDVVGADWQIDTIVDPGAQPHGTPTVTKAATEPNPSAAAAPAAPETPDAPPEWASDDPTPAESSDTRVAAAAAREAISQTRPTGTGAPRSDELTAADAEVRRDDLDADPEGLGTEDLLARELGASMIEEIKHS